LKKNNKRDVVLIILIIAILFSVASFLFEGDGEEKITYADVVRQFENQNVESYTIDGGLLTAEL